MASNSKSFVDFRKIKEEVSIEQVLAHYGLWGEFRGSGSQRRGPCPLHEHSGRNKRPFSVNVRKGLYYCFSEEEGGNVIDLTAELEACSPREAALKLRDWFGVVTPDKAPAKEKPKRAAQKTKPKQEPSEDDPNVESSPVNAPLTFEQLKHLSHDHEALLARGIMSDTAEHFGVGYATKGIMRGCIAIPVHDPQGQLLAYTGADPQIIDAPYRWPKEFRPEIELYNAHRAVEAQREAKVGLVVVGDFFDVFELYEAGVGQAVALMGEDLGTEQLAMLRSLLDHLRTPRITFAYRLMSLDDAPPYELIGRLATIAQCHAVTLESLTQ